MKKDKVEKVSAGEQERLEIKKTSNHEIVGEKKLEAATGQISSVDVKITEPTPTMVEKRAESMDGTTSITVNEDVTAPKDDIVQSAIPKPAMTPTAITISAKEERALPTELGSATDLMPRGPLDYVVEGEIYSSFSYSFVHVSKDHGVETDLLKETPTVVKDPVFGDKSANYLDIENVDSICIQARVRPFAKPWSLRGDITLPYSVEPAVTIQGAIPEGFQQSKVKSYLTRHIYMDLLSLALNKCAEQKYIPKKPKFHYIEGNHLELAEIDGGMEILPLRVPPANQRFWSTMADAAMISRANPSVFMLNANLMDHQARGIRRLGKPEGNDKSEVFTGYKTEETFRVPVMPEDAQINFGWRGIHTSMTITAQTLDDYTEIFIGEGERMISPDPTYTIRKALKAPSPYYPLFMWVMLNHFELRDALHKPYLLSLAESVTTISMDTPSELEQRLKLFRYRGQGDNTSVRDELSAACRDASARDLLNIAYWTSASIYYRPRFSIKPNVVDANLVPVILGMVAYKLLFLPRPINPPNLAYEIMGVIIRNLLPKLAATPKTGRKWNQLVDWFNGYDVNGNHINPAARGYLGDGKMFTELSGSTLGLEPMFIRIWANRPNQNDADHVVFYNMLVLASYTTFGTHVSLKPSHPMMRVPTSSSSTYAFTNANSVDRLDTINDPLEWRVFRAFTLQFNKILSLCGDKVFNNKVDFNGAIGFISTYSEGIRERERNLLHGLNDAVRITASTTVYAAILPPILFKPAEENPLKWKDMNPDLNTPDWSALYINGGNLKYTGPGHVELIPARGLGILERGRYEAISITNTSYENNRRRGDEIVTDIGHYASAFYMFQYLIKTGSSKQGLKEFKGVVINGKEDWERMVQSAEKYFPKGSLSWSELATKLTASTLTSSYPGPKLEGMLPYTRNTTYQLVEKGMLNMYEESLLWVLARQSTYGYAKGFLLGRRTIRAATTPQSPTIPEQTCVKILQVDEIQPLNGNFLAGNRPTFRVLVEGPGGRAISLGDLTYVESMHGNATEQNNPPPPVVRPDVLTRTIQDKLTTYGTIPLGSSNAKLTSNTSSGGQNNNNSSSSSSGGSNSGGSSSTSQKDRIASINQRIKGKKPASRSSGSTALVSIDSEDIESKEELSDLGTFVIPPKERRKIVEINSKIAKGLTLDPELEEEEEGEEVTVTQSKIMPWRLESAETFTAGLRPPPIPAAESVTMAGVDGESDLKGTLVMTLAQFGETAPSARRWMQEELAKIFNVIILGRVPVEVRELSFNHKHNIVHDYVFEMMPNRAPIVTWPLVPKKLAYLRETISITMDITPIDYTPIIYATNLVEGNEDFKGFKTLGDQSSASFSCPISWSSPAHSYNMYTDIGANFNRICNTSFDYTPAVLHVEG